MPADSKCNEHPIITNLKNRLAECRNELLELLTDWHYLQYIHQPRLMYIYDNIFGDLEYTIEQKGRIASSLENRIELLSLKIKRGEKITEHTVRFVNTFVEKKFNRIAEEKQAENFSYTDNYNYYNPCNSFVTRFERDKVREIPVLYRQIVKTLHPDIAGEDSENFRKYWDSVIFSYKNLDWEHLDMFHRTLCSDLEENSFSIEEEENKLREEIRTLETNISAEKRKISRLKSQEPFTLEPKLNDRFWVSNRKRMLMDRIIQIDSTIRIKEKQLNYMTKTGKLCSGNQINRLESSDFSKTRTAV